eukprot:354105-Chlamydomonas_euryale.AAC.3
MTMLRRCGWGMVIAALTMANAAGVEWWRLKVYREDSPHMRILALGFRLSDAVCSPSLLCVTRCPATPRCRKTPTPGLSSFLLSPNLGPNLSPSSEQALDGRPSAPCQGWSRVLWPFSALTKLTSASGAEDQGVGSRPPACSPPAFSTLTKPASASRAEDQGD